LAGVFAHRAPTASGVAARVRALPARLANDERTERIKEIKTDERTRKMRHAVAGFDYTFKPAKSVSVLWALADRDVREQITAAHHAAIHDALALLERDVARTRVGTDLARVPPEAHRAIDGEKIARNLVSEEPGQDQGRAACPGAGSNSRCPCAAILGGVDSG